MLTDNGYIKLYRKIFKKGYHLDPQLLTFMIYFLCHANYRDTTVYVPRVGLVPLKRGQHLFGTKKLSAFMGVTRQITRNNLKLLKNIDFLTIKTTNRFSIGTVINYDSYQSTDEQPNQQRNHHSLPAKQPPQQPTVNQQDNHREEDKNNKEEKKKENQNTPPISPSQISDSVAPKSGNGKCVWPGDFFINSKMKDYAVQKNIDPDKLEDFFLNFQSWAKATGARFHDWEAAFRIRVDNATEYGKQFLREIDPWENI